MRAEELAAGLRYGVGRRGTRWLTAGMLLIWGALVSGPGSAQTPPDKTDQGTEQQPVLQEVVITGSRIKAPNEVSTSPIQVISSESIQTTGKTDISDVITQLPQNFNNGLGQDLGNGSSGLTTAGGVATADLRGLGPNRTLVLVDGRRLGQGSPYTAIQSPAPDLDQIPAGLIDRVEVVTGGASAAYGSDAIAGVINFIMKHDFQGIELDGQWNANWHTNHDTDMQELVSQFGTTPQTGTTLDGRQKDFDLLMGTNFADNKGNITAYLSYRQADPVLSSQRDFGGCELDPVTAPNGTVTGLACAGSSNSNWFQPLTGPYATAASNIFAVYGQQLVPQGTNLALTPPASFNSQPYIYMTRQDERYNAAFLAHETIFDELQPYGEFYFMDDRTHQQPAPSALFKDSNPLDPFGSSNYPVNCSNPLLSAQEAGILCSPTQLAYAAANPNQACQYSTDPTTGLVNSPNCADVRIGRRNIEGGPRTSDYEHQNYRAVVGTKGDLFDDAWSYDAYGQYYYTLFTNTNGGYLSFQSIDNALQVAGTRSNPVCISGAPCIPYNIWTQGAVTPAQVQSLYLLGTAQGTSTLRTLHAEVTGQLGKYGITSPLAHDGIGVDVGYEHRNDHEYFQPDSAEQSGLLSGFGSAALPIDEAVGVGEEFAELRAPLMQDQPFAHDLLFDTGVRRSDYSTSGVTNSYKFELQFAPIADYRLRASFDRAIRAPSVVELYNPENVVTLQLGTDPCAPTFNSNGSIAQPALYSLAQCLNTRGNLSAAQFAALYGNGGTTDRIPQGTGSQLSGLQGGNPTLRPEVGQTFTIGVNFAPIEIHGLSGSIDYYHIDISNEVNTVPTSVIFAQCATAGNPYYCSQLFRNPVTGGLTTIGLPSGGGYVIQTNQNIASNIVSGVDVQLDYRHDLPEHWGGISFDMNGAYLQHFEWQPTPESSKYDCAGYFGLTCQTVNARWRHIFRTTWMSPWNVDFAATWRFIGPVSQDNNSPQPFLHFATFGAYDLANPHIPAYSYLDLAFTWHANTVLTVRGGINNVADKDPPLLSAAVIPGGEANTIDVYDMFGRQVFVSFTAKF
jgi:iron complex outermembrane recepter protein